MRNDGHVFPENTASSVVALPVMSHVIKLAQNSLAYHPDRALMGEFEAPKTLCDKCDQVRVNPSWNIVQGAHINGGTGYILADSCECILDQFIVIFIIILGTYHKRQCFHPLG